MTTPKRPARAARSRPSGGRKPRGRPAVWLADAERLYRDFVTLTPHRYRPFVRSFDSFDEYERWRRAQTNPWYR